jgi:hypothetical protein
MSTAAESEQSVCLLEDENTGSERLSLVYSIGHHVVIGDDEDRPEQFSAESPIIGIPARASPQSSSFEAPGSEIGTRLGQIAGGIIYATTYPVVWVDGPLPIVDVVWAFGMVKAVRLGGNIGSQVGDVLGLD